MSDKTILSYIAEQRLAGYDDIDILNALRAAGWKDQIVQQHLNAEHQNLKGQKNGNFLWLGVAYLVGGGFIALGIISLLDAIFSGSRTAGIVCLISLVIGTALIVTSGILYRQRSKDPNISEKSRKNASLLLKIFFILIIISVVFDAVKNQFFIYNLAADEKIASPPIDTPSPPVPFVGRSFSFNYPSNWKLRANNNKVFLEQTENKTNSSKVPDLEVSSVPLETNRFPVEKDLLRVKKLELDCDQPKCSTEIVNGFKEYVQNGNNGFDWQKRLTMLSGPGTVYYIMYNTTNGNNSALPVYRNIIMSMKGINGLSLTP